MPHSQEFRNTAESWKVRSRIRTYNQMNQEVRQNGAFSDHMQRFVDNRNQLENTNPLRSGNTQNFLAVRALHTQGTPIHVDRERQQRAHRDANQNQR